MPFPVRRLAAGSVMSPAPFSAILVTPFRVLRYTTCRKRGDVGIQVDDGNGGLPGLGRCAGSGAPGLGEHLHGTSSGIMFRSIRPG